MSSTSNIILLVPRAPTESIFLHSVIQAAIRAYREDVKQHHNVDRFEEVQRETTSAILVSEESWEPEQFKPGQQPIS